MAERSYRCSGPHQRAAERHADASMASAFDAYFSGGSGLGSPAGSLTSATLSVIDTAV
jgi:hypothetical protein